MTPRSSSRFTLSDLRKPNSAPELRNRNAPIFLQDFNDRDIGRVECLTDGFAWTTCLTFNSSENAERLPIIIYSTPKRKLALFPGAAARGTDMADIVILPGIGGSGETHWQSHWEKANSRMRRFEPMNWEQPDLDDWTAALDRAVGAATEPPLLVAHSLACLLVAHWQRVSSLSVVGAFLVAVPDPESDAFPAEAAPFAHTPKGKFRFPSLIIASSDDPYGKLDYARTTAIQWGSGIVEAGALGHINGRSGLEDWPGGLALLTAFAAGAGFAMSASTSIPGLAVGLR